MTEHGCLDCISLADQCATFTLLNNWRKETTKLIFTVE